MLIVVVGIRTEQFISNCHAVIGLTLGNDLLQTHASSLGTNLIWWLKRETGLC